MSDSPDSDFSKDIYRTITEHSTTGIYILNRDKKFVFVNKTMEKLLGYTREELLVINYLELVSPDYRAEVEKMTNQALTGDIKGLPLRPQFMVVRKNGEKMWVENIPTLVKYKGKIAILGNVRDITRQKIMEKRTENSGILYRELGKAVNLSSNLGQLCEKDLNALKKVVNCDMADILIYNPDKNTLNLCAQLGFPDELKVKTIVEQKVEKKECKVAAFSAHTRKSLFIKNMQEHGLARYAHSLLKKYNITQMYTIPLISGTKLEGVLQVLVQLGKSLSKNDREILDIVSEQIAAGIAKIRAEERLKELIQKDHLTALYNHQYFWEKFEEQKNREERWGEVYSVIYLDIDNFKRCNDTYGHLEGDRILKILGKILTGCVRKMDSACRYGGEEFVILCPHTHKEQARRLAERIQDEIHRTLYPKYKITMSIGVTDSKTAKNPVRAADKAMYEAKKEGKNRIKIL